MAAGGGFGGAGNPFDADYGALMQISRTTGGTFYRAQDADQLATALARLPAAFTIVRKHIDIASWFAAGGGLLIAAAVALSLWWNRTRRMPAPREDRGSLTPAAAASALIRAAMAGSPRSLSRQRPRSGPILPTGMLSDALIWA